MLVTRFHIIAGCRALFALVILLFQLSSTTAQPLGKRLTIELEDGQIISGNVKKEIEPKGFSVVNLWVDGQFKKISLAAKSNKTFCVNSIIIVIFASAS